MGGKHLKRMRAEKSKVQLKKKKLPKGQNITDTSFKVKKIITIEQLKKPDESEPLSNWNITLKDLLTHLNHYNYTSRLNGLSGIKEILVKNPEIVLGPSLKPLISRLLELITDEEHKIRITTVELISHLLGLLPHDLIIPFHDILNLNLACAMTHRNASVQHDALKFVDIIIKHSPEALMHNLQMITQNFVRIIKTSLYGSQSGVFPEKAPKPELEKGKTEKLVKFYQFMAACYPSRNVEFDLRKYDRNASEKISLRDLCNSYKETPDLFSLFKNSESKVKGMKGSDSPDIKSLCNLVMPMLFDTWTEFSPNQRSDVISSECVLTGAVGELLCVILKSMLLLQENVKALQDPQMEYWFNSNYSQPFKKSFISNFPYFPSASKKSKSINEISKEGFSTYLKHNLIICYFSYSFKLVQKNSDLETKMEDYISSALTMKNPTEVDILTKVIEVAINSVKFKNSNILSMAIEVHDTTNNSSLRQSLSKALTKVALEDIENLSEKNCTVRNWMVSLSHRLCSSQIFIHEIETILKLISKSSGSDVLKEVEIKAEEIICNLPNIKIEGVDTLEGQRMIARVLYRCNNAILERITTKEVLFGDTLSEELRKYVLEIFSYKLNSRFY